MDDVEQCRQLYSQTVRSFELIDELSYTAMTAYFWVVEEKRRGSPHATSRIKDAKRRIDRFSMFELGDLAERL